MKIEIDQCKKIIQQINYLLDNNKIDDLVRSYLISAKYQMYLAENALETEKTLKKKFREEY